MTPTTIGMTAGAVLAFAALVFGFWGFLLTLVLMLCGALAGRIAEGKLDLRGVLDALSGRRSSS
ncbi:DUF2273 domain-containing protein [Arthrobacter agilis]|uniref:DUF2273 domain-containing protein n=1 Tax=Arthrobacter agilis TaxID=37921 RepID=UPI000B3626F9|nr:DUF2273 domain-containing protein [Arthrobacter agilis]OUM43606.1 hypothetical protein B8W74_05420 [Arthrobacter agilis]PPB46807.1 DUF2273 domain-containing protein [Arthrobacter agilis]TPV24851.1 DUF2273 domain-containing protein [Arthrobacter agilis]VDR31003.1 Small integral membrane protein (DUF2273) [Arthrobacter agilis]